MLVVPLDETEEARGDSRRRRAKTERCSALWISQLLKAILTPPIWLHSAQKVWQPLLVLPEPSWSGYLHVASRHLTTCETRAAWESPHPQSAPVFASQCSSDIIRFMFLRAQPHYPPTTTTTHPHNPSWTFRLHFLTLLPIAAATPRTSSEASALAKREEDDSIS